MRQLLARLAPEAIECLRLLMQPDQPGRVRVAAATAVLDRAGLMPVAAEAADVGAAGSLVDILRQLAVQRLAEQQQQRVHAREQQQPVIDGAATDVPAEDAAGISPGIAPAPGPSQVADITATKP